MSSPGEEEYEGDPYDYGEEEEEDHAQVPVPGKITSQEQKRHHDEEDPEIMQPWRPQQITDQKCCTTSHPFGMANMRKNN